MKAAVAAWPACRARSASSAVPPAVPGARRVSSSARSRSRAPRRSARGSTRAYRVCLRKRRLHDELGRWFDRYVAAVTEGRQPHLGFDRLEHGVRAHADVAHDRCERIPFHLRERQKGRCRRGIGNRGPALVFRCQVPTISRVRRSNVSKVLVGRRRGRDFSRPSVLFRHVAQTRHGSACRALGAQGLDGTICRLVIVPQALHSTSSTPSPRGLETVSWLPHDGHSKNSNVPSGSGPRHPAGHQYACRRRISASVIPPSALPTQTSAPRHVGQRG